MRMFAYNAINNFSLTTYFTYRNASKLSVQVLIQFSKLWGERLFESGHLLEGVLISLLQLYMKFTTVTCRNFVTYYHLQAHAQRTKQ